MPYRYTLIALSFLSAMAYAHATSVQLYGTIDGALDYQHTKVQGEMKLANLQATASHSESSFGMGVGHAPSSILGVHGRENLGNNTWVGFTLEHGFALPSGNQADPNKFFNRQSTLTLGSSFGELTLGRTGSLASGMGPYGIMGQITDNFGGGWGKTIGLSRFAWTKGERLDNSITYASPNFGGVKLYGQYSFTMKGRQGDKMRSNDRYAAIGATFEMGPVSLVGVVDRTFYKNDVVTYLLPPLMKIVTKPSLLDDSYTFNVGAKVNTSFAKLYAGYQHATHLRGFGKASTNGYMDYMVGTGLYASTVSSVASLGLAGFTIGMALPILKNPDYITMLINQAGGLKADALRLGADIPLGSGTLKAQIGYSQAKTHRPYMGSTVKNASFKAKAYGLAIGYEYNLSKRTMLYAGAGYSHQKFTAHAELMNNKLDASFKSNTYEGVMGLMHKF